MLATRTGTPTPTRTRLTKVVVAGGTGRMGRVMMSQLPQEHDLEIVGGFGSAGERTAGQLLDGADVMVDFTRGPVAPRLIMAALRSGARVVSGTSGITEDAFVSIDQVARDEGLAVFHCPTFRVSSALAMHFARIAARYLDRAEIIETHHDGKADSPSGTAVTIARAIRESRGENMVDAGVRHESLPGARGAEHGGVRIHSLRVAGIFGRHEIVMSAPDEMLRITCEENSREGHASAVARTIREVLKTDRVGLIRGYEQVIGLA
ncbi:MAG: 4-hydroxy-tetrahydrodipicolinate reductase [Chloroflexi bacterium]|nr:4-hydroxy-tetrahydrodipicolinate reductase [Chloroflexota bacterium]